MFYINNIKWYLKFVPHNDKNLYKRNGKYTIGMCDNNTHTIYIEQSLTGTLLHKVICHELTHAAMFSYKVELDYKQEELLADLIATYGEEIIDITNKIFGRLQY